MSHITHTAYIYAIEAVHWFNPSSVLVGECSSASLKWRQLSGDAPAVIVEPRRAPQAGGRRVTATRSQGKAQFLLNWSKDWLEKYGHIESEMHSNTIILGAPYPQRYRTVTGTTCTLATAQPQASPLLGDHAVLQERAWHDHLFNGPEPHRHWADTRQLEH